uniref:F-box only protein 25 n=1 Tax=Lepeophtheirus salmonis TaxID=72036 RepID=D3PHI6_LEPSM|nr:F-box only protein 25 [Lepeophtheirus salmonis]
MPFLSKDWRGPGEEWVRYQGGWEMKKCFQSVKTEKKSSLTSDIPVAPTAASDPTPSKCHVKRLLRIFEMKLANNSFKRAPSVDEEDYEEIQEETQKTTLDEEEDERDKIEEVKVICPSYPVVVKCTKEIAGFNELAEGILRLDFPGALRDVRRFRYVARVVHILLRHDKLRTLSGAAQKLLFRLLEEMADVVYENQSHEDVLHSLLQELHSTMAIYNVWGSHLGSARLFQEHVERRRKITEFVERMQDRYKQDLMPCSLDHPNLVQILPEECVREVLLRLSDKKDLTNASRTCIVMESIVKEKRIWRELVQAHFTKPQIECLLKQHPNFKESGDWKSLYDSLRKKWDPKETFGDLPYLCRSCCSLYWRSLEHICQLELAEREVTEDVPIMPNTFLSFFSV